MKRLWTARETATLSRLYSDMPTVDIALVLNRTVPQVYRKAAALGLKKSTAYLGSPAACRLRRGDNVGEKHQFKKGQTPWNKDKPGSAGTHPNSRRTQFKKGAMTGAAQRNYVPIGTTRISKDGALEKKVSDDPAIYPARRWAPVARLVWEGVHGPVPDKHVVRFRPGLQTAVEVDITIEKLECISLAENMRRNSYHNYPPEIAKAIQLRGALNRRINNVEKHQ